MSRGVDATLLAALAADVVRPALFVHLGFDEPINLWTGLRSITTLGSTYAPTEGKMEITPISETLDGAQQQATLTIENLAPSDALAPRAGTGTGFIWVTQVVNYSGADVTITAPTNAKEMKVHTWGAGGSPDGYFGGYGGYTFTHHRTASGTQYKAVVGRGGINLTTVYGFGGTGQGVAHQHNGGGLTGLFTGTGAVSASQYTRAINIAGGGGAGGWNGSAGRSGGNGNDADSGGSSNMQGHEATGTVNSGQGGGGGGYRGGAYKGNPGENLYGVGGSGYGKSGGLSAKKVMATKWPATGVPGPKHASYDGVAGESGQHGQMIIEWKVEVPIEEADAAVSASVYLGAMDIDGNLVGTPQAIFSGTVDAIGWDYGPADISATIELIGGPGIVEATTGQRYSAEGQKKKFPTDKGLDYLPAIQTTNLTWGANS